jgi:hypothetical protein
MLGRHRRRDPGELAFEAVATHVEAAKEALLAAVPGPRRPPAPLAPALAIFEEEIRRARASLEGWGGAATGEIRATCEAALDEAARRGEWLRLEAPTLDFESLVIVLGDLLAPLDAFVDAERALRGRRPRP